MAFTISFYDQFKEDLFNKLVNLASDTIKIALLSSSYTYSAAHSTYADLTNEVANGNGYTTGGQALTTKVATKSGSTTKFDADDPTWTASGGSIGPAAKAAIYDVTNSNRLICFLDLGGSNTAGDGTQFKITFNAAGIFTLTG